MKNKHLVRNQDLIKNRVLKSHPGLEFNQENHHQDFSDLHRFRDLVRDPLYDYRDKADPERRFMQALTEHCIEPED